MRFRFAAFSGTYTFSGNRITRGQSRTAREPIIHADANGSLNIMRKSNRGDHAFMTLQNGDTLGMPSEQRSPDCQDLISKEVSL